MQEGCSQSFSTKYNLKRHIDTVHLKILRFQCMICSRLCVSQQVLNDHMNSHSGERPFQCEVCGASYKHSSKLSFHRRKHKKNGEIQDRAPKISRTVNRLLYCVHPSTTLPSEISVQLPPIKFKESYDEILPQLETILGNLRNK